MNTNELMKVLCPKLVYNLTNVRSKFIKFNSVLNKILSIHGRRSTSFVLVSKLIVHDDVLFDIFLFLWLCSGKTYTMVGTHSDPGLMVLSFRTIFELIKKDDSKDTFEVSCSYLEVYNEVFALFLLYGVLGFDERVTLNSYFIILT